MVVAQSASIVEDPSCTKRRPRPPRSPRCHIRHRSPAAADRATSTAGGCGPPHFTTKTAIQLERRSIHPPPARIKHTRELIDFVLQRGRIARGLERARAPLPGDEIRGLARDDQRTQASQVVVRTASVVELMLSAQYATEADEGRRANIDLARRRETPIVRSALVRLRR